MERTFMKKSMILLALFLVPLVGSCELQNAVEEALNPVANCDARETAAQSCLEYTGLVTVTLSSQYQEACQGTWNSGTCNRANMRGGCQKEVSETANLTITTWTLGTPGSPETEATKATCESGGGTWVEP